MEILYSVLNFAILLGLIWLIGRKTILSLFRQRRRSIETALHEPEHPTTEDEASPLPSVMPAEDPDDAVTEAKEDAAQRIARVRSYTALECQELHVSKLKKERAALLSLFAQQVAAHFADDRMMQLSRQKDAQMWDAVLSAIRLTPGDMAYLRYHDILYVTVTSAYPLEQETIDRVETAVSALLATVNGKMSFWVRENPALISGFCLRIGDTVYDASVAEQLYRFSHAIEKQPVAETDTVDSLMAAFAARADDASYQLSVYQLGRVISVSDGICWMDGLADIMYGEVIEFECGERGMVLDIQKDRIGCVIFGQYEHIESYSRVRRVGRIASVPVGDGLLGRVVNAIGNPIDGKGRIRTDDKRPIECAAPGILDRAAVSRPLHTGIKAIDALVPIGKGQRELIVGDRQTGKTAIILDTILHQRGKNVICIYVGIGQKETTVSDFREKLEAYGALSYTVLVSATASESAAMQYIAPFAGTAIGEGFMYRGKDVLIIYDDLSKHAVAYRELSLLLQRPSGREAYPGDVFYLHSRLLERSAQLSDALGGGSLTALPIIETQAGDIASYIPTNVISITDGQIFLDGELFHEGQRPAVNVGLSVSRVGGAAQTKLMKQVSADLRTKLAQYRELAEFTQFGADMDSETKQTLNTGKHLTEALKQGRFSPLDDWKQSLLLYTFSKGFADDVPIDRIADFETALYQTFETDHPETVSQLKTGRKLTAEQQNELDRILTVLSKRD